MPRVSVVIPTYNRCAYVQEAIDSVLAQTYTDYEIIVIDDGSTDGTGEALRRRYGDRIRYVWQENQGQAAARNHGIALACGDYVAFLDSDDTWLPDKLTSQVAYLDEHPEVGFVFSEAWKVDAAGRVIDGSRVNACVCPEDLSLEAQLFENHILAPSTVVVRTEPLVRVGGFDPAIRNVEDYDLLTRLCQTTSVALIHEPLVCYRVHGENVTQLSVTYNEQWRDGHRSTLSKVFAAWPDAPGGLEERALAWLWARSALMEGVLGNEEMARQYLVRAAATDVSFLTSPERFCARAAGFAARIYGACASDGWCSGSGYLELVARALAAVGWTQPRLRRRVRSSGYEAIGYAAHGRQDRATARRALSRALILDPSLARNAGVWSILFEAVFGPRISALRRRALARARGIIRRTGTEAPA